MRSETGAIPLRRIDGVCSRIMTMNINPHREYDPTKGSMSAKLSGATQVIGGDLAMTNAAILAAKGRHLPHAKKIAAATAAIGAASYYMGVRTYKAGKARPA